MFIKSTSISINYEKINNLKMIYYHNDEILKAHFNEATVLPVPDEAPMEVPRIVAITKNEHAQLSITPVAATIQIDYDNGYEHEWKKCESYIKELMVIVFNFFDKIADNKYKYMGIVTTLFLDDFSGNVAQILSSNLLKENNKELYDINIRYTFTKGSDEFINISLQNARMFKNEADENKAGLLSENYEICQHVGVVIDINNRYAFNTIEGYTTPSQEINNLLNTMTDVVQNKLTSLVRKGVYENGE